MRIFLSIVFFYLALVSMAFSDSLDKSHYKGELSQVLTGKIPEHDGSGFYTGMILGSQFGRSSDQTGAFGYNADNDSWDYSESGFNAGAELGYGYSFHQFVIGPEIELGYLTMDGQGAQPLSPNLDTVGKTSGHFYTALRARIGTDFRSNLIYVTGGAIGVNYSNKVIDSCSIAPCGGSTVYANKNGFVWGYTVGGGIEHLFQNNWSVKLEYLYFNLDSHSFTGATDLGNTYSWIGHSYGNIIRGGINYYF